MNRRKFLVQAVATAGAAMVSLPILSASERAVPARKKGVVLLVLLSPDGKGSVLRYFDWDSFSTTREVALPINDVHSVLRDRRDPSVIYAFQSQGSSLRYDMDARRGIGLEEPGLVSAGHAVQSLSGELLFCTERRVGGGSILSLRKARTFERVATAPPECGQAHHVIHLPGGPRVACGNSASIGPGASAGGVAFFDYDKRQLISHVPIDLPILHLCALSDTEVLAGAVSSRPKDASYRSGTKRSVTHLEFLPGPLYYVNADGTTRKIWDESRSELFLFNFAIAPLGSPGAFLSSHQRSNKVLLWKDSKVAHVWDVQRPTNLLVSGTGQEFMVNASGVAQVFSLKTLASIATIREPGRPVLTLGAY